MVLHIAFITFTYTVMKDKLINITDGLIVLLLVVCSLHALERIIMIININNYH